MKIGDEILSLNIQRVKLLSDVLKIRLHKNLVWIFSLWKFFGERRDVWRPIVTLGRKRHGLLWGDADLGVSEFILSRGVLA